MELSFSKPILCCQYWKWRETTANLKRSSLSTDCEVSSLPSTGKKPVLYRQHPPETSASFGAGAWGCSPPQIAASSSSLPSLVKSPPACLPYCWSQVWNPRKGESGQCCHGQEGTHFGPTLNLCGSDSENIFFLHNLNLKSSAHLVRRVRSPTPGPVRNSAAKQEVSSWEQSFCLRHPTPLHHSCYLLKHPLLFPLEKLSPRKPVPGAKKAGTTAVVTSQFNISANGCFFENKHTFVGPKCGRSFR